MSAPVFIRQATDDDLPAVLALYAQPGLDDGETLSIDQARAVLAEFARYPSYRLSDGAQIIGRVPEITMRRVLT